jgi:hypothetical protein
MGEEFRPTNTAGQMENYAHFEELKLMLERVVADATKRKVLK